jgi:monoterpene epsilon-lactone hydrolase
VRSITGAIIKQVDAKAADAHSIRRRFHAVAKLLISAFGVQVSPDKINGLPVEWLTPKNAPEDKLILYLHGGGYIMGGCSTHRQIVSHIARAAGFRAVVPEYRLAPEHPFPAAIDDAVAVYRSLISTGLTPDDIILVGDSAGGGLAMALLLSLRDAGDPLPAAVCLLSPWLDLALTGETITTRADSDPWFRAEILRLVAHYYCNDDEVRNPLASPIFADVSGLPPLFIQVGGDEILLSDSTRLAENVRSCGGTVEIEVWPAMWHVFQVFIGKMPESRRAVEKIGAYIHSVMNKSD